MAPGKKVLSLREELLRNVERTDLVEYVSKRCKVPSSAVDAELQRLVDEGLIERDGSQLRLAEREIFSKLYELSKNLQEDQVWAQDIKPLLGFLPKNVLALWNYCFTEMFNNAIDHSEADLVGVQVTTNNLNSEITIHDNGIGIFEKIRRALSLSNQQEAVLELAKGKFTTDRSRHSGLGIFFSSRMVDRFEIISGPVFFRHEAGLDDQWLIESRHEEDAGTSVFLTLSDASQRKTVDVFEHYSNGKTFDFNKTVVPVVLALAGGEPLVSRSQAKRVLSRVDQFSEVIFDFHDVESIGQGFADEIFRVFASQHPRLRMAIVHANSVVGAMIQAVRKQARKETAAERKATPVGKRPPKPQ